MKKIICFVLTILILVFPLYTIASAEDGSTTVYITRTGECYHMATCSYLAHSSIPITLEDAVARGKRPCSRCHPPLLASKPASTPYMAVVSPPKTSTAPVKRSLSGKTDHSDIVMKIGVGFMAIYGTCTLIKTSIESRERKRK